MRLNLPAVLAAVMFGLAACGSHAATAQATPGTLQQMLDNARGGDTIRLAAGDYEAVQLKNKKWDPPIVVEAGDARLTSVSLDKVSGLTWRGGMFDGKDTVRVAFGAGRSDHIVVENLKVVHYVRGGIIFGQSSDVRIAGNTFSEMGSDGINVALSRRFVVDRNTCRDFYPRPKAHPDCIQLWSRPSDPPTADVTITNNVAHGNMQGIGMFNHVRDGVNDGGFDRITITGNTIDSMHSQALAATSCRQCVVNNNVVRGLPGAAHYAQLNLNHSPDMKACGNKTDSMKEASTAKCGRDER